MLPNNSIASKGQTDEGIDLNSIIDTIKRYKLSILLVIGIAIGLAVYITMSATKVYRGDLQLQIKAQSVGEASGGSASNFLDKAFEVKGENIDNEIAVLKSHSVISKALSKLQVGTHYYVTHNFRSVEVYKDAPFSVDVEAIAQQLNHAKFQLNAVDEDHFKLVIRPAMKAKILFSLKSLISTVPQEDQPINFEGTFEFGKPISNHLFRITVHKTGDMTKEDYAFTLTEHEYLVTLIQKALRVGVVSDKSSVILMSYEDNIPQRAKDILNGIAQTYQEQNIELKRSSAQKTLDFIDEQLKEINGALQQSANDLESYKTSHVVIDLKEKATMTAQKMNELETQRNELEIQEEIYEKLLRDFRADKQLVGFNIGAVSIDGSPLRPLIEKLNEATTQRSALLADYTENHPSVIKVSRQIESLKASIKGALENGLRGIQQRKSSLDLLATRKSGILKSIPKEEMQISQLTNNFLTIQKNYEYLLQKRAEIAIAESSTVSTVRILDEALVGDNPIKPIPLLNIVAGFLLGVIIGLGQAFLRNYFQNSIQSIHDIEKLTTLPLYAVLPHFKDKRTLYDEALKIMLTKLDFHPLVPQVINFASSVEGEGKTTTALNFADIIRQSGKSVIVVDLDLRKPKIHDRLSLDNTKGVSTVLTGASSLEETIVQYAPRFDVLTAGPIPQNPYELLMTGDLRMILRQLKSRYDYVLLQSPPIGLAADALVLMRLADMSFMIFRAYYSRKDFIQYINRFAKEHRIDTLSLILTNLELEKIRPWSTK